MLIFAILSCVFLCTECLASTKKGITLVAFQCGDLEPFTNINWWYDYTLDYDYMKYCKEAQDTPPGFVPMVDGRLISTEKIQSLSSDVILGFNEPNKKNGLNMTTEEAAMLWRKLEAAATDQRTLVSPAVVPCTKPDCNYNRAIRWFTDFFNQCNDCRFDYLATHAFWCNASYTMNYLEDLWKTFKKPIWLTQFACAREKSEDAQLEFMKEILPQLEAADYIDKYAWYATRRGLGTAHYLKESISLVFGHNPKQLTKLGQYYNDY